MIELKIDGDRFGDVAEGRGTTAPSRFDKHVPERKDSGNPAESTAIVNTAAVDLEGDVVVPEGGDTSLFETTRSIFWNHEYFAPGLPVGALRGIKLVPEGWRATWSWASHPFAQDVRTLVDEGAVNGTSIGFEPIDVGPPTEDEVEKYGSASRVVRKWRMFEFSVVALPCNPTALIERSRGDGAMPDEFLGAVDNLARKGRIRRESLEMLGLPDKPRRRVVVVC